MSCALAMTPLAAYAALDGQTVKLRLNPTVGYDSNVFRLPSGATAPTFNGSSQRSDVITSVGAGATVDWTQGRQRVLLDATATDNRYSHFDFLNHVASDLRAQYYWQIGDAWSGDIGYSANRGLTSFGDFRAPVKNIQKLERTAGTAYYRVWPRVRLKLGGSGTELTNNTQLRKPNDREETAYEAGVQYESSEANVFGLQARRTEGDFPYPAPGTPANGAFDQTDLEAIVNWRPTGISRLTGFVGYTRRTHPALTVRDFSGPSGRLFYDWTPAGRMSYSFSVRREIGAYTDVDTSYVLTTGAAAAAAWNITGRTTMTARAERRTRDFLGDQGTLPPGQVPREDTTNTYGLSVAYSATRKIDLSLLLTHEQRSANRALLDYRVNSAFVAAQITF